MTIRGIREPIVAGIIGRTESGKGPPRVLTFTELVQQLKLPASAGGGGGSSGGGGGLSKTLPSGDIYVGNASNLATPIALSGDGTLANTGALTVASSKVLDHLGNTQGNILYRNATVWTVLAPGTAGQVLQTQGASANPQWTSASSITANTDADIDMIYFGAGSDGNVTISSNTTNLSRDMFYANLTLSGTGILNTNGWRVFVSGVLDITAAAANALVHYNATGGALTGGAASTFAGGGGANGPVGNSIGGGPAGGPGGTGGTGVGPNGAGGGGSTHQIHSKGGQGGAGGTGTPNAGGTAAAGNTSNFDVDINRLTTELFMIVGTAVTVMQGGGSGTGAGAGGGDGTNRGGGGGGSGAAGGIVWLAARTINRGSSTAAAAINTNGGDGGAGGIGAATGNIGGGGGGAGSGGGWLYLVYRFLTGTAATNVLSSRGGNGGAGGNGRGTGNGGAGGGAGSRGRILVFNLATGSSAFADSNTTVVAGNAASGNTGGTGATANTQQMSL